MGECKINGTLGCASLIYIYICYTNVVGMYILMTAANLWATFMLQ